MADTSRALSPGPLAGNDDLAGGVDWSRMNQPMGTLAPGPEIATRNPRVQFSKEDVDKAQGVALSMGPGPMGGAASSGKVSETMARYFNKHIVPEPKPFLDRIWDNYAKHMSVNELWDSEAIWGNARRMVEEAGWKEHEAFAYLMNEMLRRKGENGFVSAEMAQEYMAGAITKAKMQDLMHGGK